MPKFLFEASYTQEGVKGVQSAGGSARRDAIAKMTEGIGGKVESFYFAFGDTDAYVIVDAPDTEAAAAAALAVNASGGAGGGRCGCAAVGGLPTARSLTTAAASDDSGSLGRHQHRRLESRCSVSLRCVTSL
jgi:uncharacterized protein with GYD domain